MRLLRFAALGALAALAGCSPDNTEPNPPREATNPVVPEQAVTTSSDTIPALADALIRTSARHSNHGGAQTMMVKITQSQDDSTRVVIKFDQAAIAAAIGSGTLTRATLELGIEQSGTESENRLDAHRLVLPWTEFGVTWRCGTDLNLANVSADCPSTKWRMSGPDMDAFMATRTDRAHLNPGQTGVAKFNVTADVQAFLGGAANHGWVIMAANATSRAVVWSRETAVKPRLVLSIDRTEAEPVPPVAPNQVPPEIFASSNIVTSSTKQSGRFLRDIVTVLFAEGTDQTSRQQAISQINGQVVGGYGLADGDGFYLVKIPTDGTDEPLFRAIDTLQASQHVELATPEILMEEPTGYRRPDDGGQWKGAGWQVHADQAQGQNHALEAINAPLAWGCGTGGSDIRVAVVDNGLARFVPDLEPNVQFAFRPGLFPNVFQHGTAVASVLGAVGDNQSGITGMMWQANLRLYEAGAVDLQGAGLVNAAGVPVITATSVAAAVSMAAIDASVINLSLYHRWQGTPSSRADSQVVHQEGRLLTAAYQRIPVSARPLLVVIAGNNSGLNPFWSGFPQVALSFPNNVLVVAASDPTTQQLYTASSHGGVTNIAAPGVDVAFLQPDGTIGVASGTSLAAPLVSGVAGLLLGFDPRLKTKDLHDFILEGAASGGRRADSYPVLDAYETLKRAAAEMGAPLCGNRVWAADGGIKAQRRGGTEQLVGIGSSATFLNVFHGGRRIDWVDPDYNVHSAVLDGTAWAEVPGSSNDVPGGTYHSMGVFDDWWYSGSHDGDLRIRATWAYHTSSLVEIQLQTSRDGGQTQTDTLAPFFENGVDNTTTTCYYRVGRWDGLTGEFIGYDCRNNASAGFYRALTAQAYFYPSGNKALLVVRAAESMTTMLTEFEKCPWASVDRGINTEECRSVRHESGDQSAMLYEVDLTSGQRTPLFSVPGRQVVSAGVSEADDEVMLLELKQTAGYDQVPYDDGTVGFNFVNVHSSTGDCQAEWYQLGALTTPFRVPSQDFCDRGWEGGGTIAPVRLKNVMLPNELAGLSHILPTPENAMRNHGKPQGSR